MRYINSSLGLILFSLVIFLFFTKKEKEISLPPHNENIRTDLPLSPFPQNTAKLGEGPLALKWKPPSLTLPDLRGELLFYGQNMRPDSKSDKPSFHIGLKNSQEINSVEQGERVYLIYERVSAFTSHHDFSWNGIAPTVKGTYAFSPHNTPTSLWFQLFKSPSSQEESVNITVAMVDEMGSEISTPSNHKHFPLNVTSQRFSFEIDGLRADPSLLSRQKARWMGQDLFLKMHGGDEFAHTSSKERIDFTLPEGGYSCFVAEGDLLVWQNGRWTSSRKTRHLPLLVVKKIEERTMHFDIWDAEGKSKVSLCLIRSHEPPLPPLEETFKFTGAKTWAQYNVECDGKRMTVHSNDWLLYSHEGWQKLTTPEEIDAYVAGERTGPLLVFEKMVKEKGNQVLHAHLFNASRSIMEEVALICDQPSVHREIHIEPLQPPPPTLSELPREAFLWVHPQEDTE